MKETVVRAHGNLGEKLSKQVDGLKENFGGLSQKLGGLSENLGSLKADLHTRDAKLEASISNMIEAKVGAKEAEISK